MAIIEIEKIVLDGIDPQRILDLTINLVRIPSPTGQEAEAQNFFADFLSQLGLEVEIDNEYPCSPTVIARLKGVGNGKFFQINGHMDTVPLEHAPPFFQDGLIYGRGACDMKCGLAAMAEAARAILESGVRLKGDLILTVTGMHERPGAKKESIISLARSENLGDAVLIAECGETGVPIVQKGLVIFEIEISREGSIMHEMAVPKDAVHPIWAGWRMMQLLKNRSDELAEIPPNNPHLEPDSLFVGMVQSGEFFNTLPTSFKIWGTRRWSPGVSYEEIEAEFQSMCRRIEKETGANVTIELDKIGEGCQLREDDPLVRLVQEVCEDVIGKAWPVTGMIVAADAWIFNNIGKVPCTYHGADLSRAHSNPEYVALSDVVRTAKVYALSTLRFAGCLQG